MNTLGEDITNKVVIIREDWFKPQFQDVRYRVFRAEAGFGCYPSTRGTAIVGTFLVDGERTRIEGPDVERYATDVEITLATIGGS